MVTPATCCIMGRGLLNIFWDIAQLHERTGYDFGDEWVNPIDVLYHNSVLSVFGTRKMPPWSVPPRWISPDQIPPNLTLTETLTLTQVRIHRGELTRGIFRTPFYQNGIIV